MRQIQVLLLLAVILPSPLKAQSTSTAEAEKELNTSAYIPEKEEDVVKGRLEEGFSADWVVSANFSFGSSSQVIGQADGDTATWGLDSDFGFFYKDQRNEWRNKFLVSEATTRTATIDRYVKSSDDLKYETSYLHGLKSYPNIGPYLMASLETSIFFGEDVRAEEKTYKFKDSTRADIVSDHLRLTDGFRPLTLKESMGFFATLINTKQSKFEVRSGVGALQVEADDQLAIDDDSSTDAIEVKVLESFKQAGFELGLEWSGRYDKKTTYKLSINSLTPIIHDFNENNDEKKSNYELTNIYALIKLTSTIYSWANVSYEFNLKRQPQLLDEYQIQHRLVVNITHQMF